MPAYYACLPRLYSNNCTIDNGNGGIGVGGPIRQRKHNEYYTNNNSQHFINNLMDITTTSNATTTTTNASASNNGKADISTKNIPFHVISLESSMAPVLKVSILLTL